MAVRMSWAMAQISTMAQIRYAYSCMSDETLRTPRTLHVDFSTSSIARVFIAIALGFAVAAGVASSRRVFSWVIACAIAAALLELVVDWLDSYVRRSIAILIVLLLAGCAIGVMAFGVLNELDHDVKRLQFLSRVAAHDIASTPRYEKLASEFELESRVGAVVDQLRSPSSGLAGQAVSSVATYLFCVILTVLFLSWGPRILESALRELRPHQRKYAHDVTNAAFNRTRRYIALALAQSLAVGLLALVACKAAGLPATPPLALTVAVFAFLPNIGIVVGALPMLLLALGLTSPNTTMALAFSVLFAQLFSTYVFLPRLTRFSHTRIGPATIAIAALFGFELYGVGGAIYAVTLSIFATAAMDAINATRASLTKPAQITGSQIVSR